MTTSPPLSVATELFFLQEENKLTPSIKINIGFDQYNPDGKTED